MDDPATRKIPMSSTMSQIHHPVPLYLARKEPSPSAQSARGNAHLILDPDQSYISSLVSKPRASPQKEWKVATIKIIKVVAGATAIIGTALAINYAVRSYRLAQWTAAKDFMQQCQNAQNPPDLCHGLEDKVLGPPPYASNDYYVDAGQKRVSRLIGRERPNTGRDVNLPLANTEVNDASSYHPILLLVVLLTLASLKFIVPFLKQRSYLHRNWISGEDRLVPWLGPYGRLRNGQIPEHVDNGISSSVDLASIPDRPILRLRHGRMRDLCARPPNIKVETKFTAATVETAEQVVHSQAQFISSSINMAKEIQFTINSLDVTNETAKGMALGTVLERL